MCACVCMCVCVSRGGGDKVGRKGEEQGEDEGRWSCRDNRGILVQQNEGMIGEEE